mmetsp:Transcript_1508/g.3530  ORF Transcript_1508/g.3530 Transcript_1508/m.3530 type:complete len:1183 (-) Transcript_1508:315-3863(-)|eukprot:CAMPEP_0179001780 /NCGR_PEP_ID=MMETSP0795-20121207/11581_1 /TAXON_ID=88552 /ORGANISM="Amoebophrya sp., Strain Ameob2" /LENGTH=1182 /DNA_ID=CAMNT_0020695253 /DNA_START=32 /DNA_END=3580 /DNA_ORIENTATION=-
MAQSTPQLPQIRHAAGQRTAERDFLAPKPSYNPQLLGGASPAAGAAAAALPLTKDRSRQSLGFDSTIASLDQQYSDAIADQQRLQRDFQRQRERVRSPDNYYTGGAYSGTSGYPPSGLAVQQGVAGGGGFNPLGAPEHLRILDESQRLLKSRQEDLERVCLTQIKQCESDVTEKSTSLRRQMNSLETFLKDEVQSKLRILADESARSKRFVTKEVETLSEELIELKKNLLSADPWNNRTRFYQLEEQVKSIVAGRSALPDSGERSPGSARAAAVARTSSLSPATHNRSLRAEKQERERLQDLVDDAVSKVDLNALDKVSRLEREIRARDVDMMARYSEVMEVLRDARDNPTSMKAGAQLSKMYKSASELLNDAAQERHAGTGEALVANSEITRTQFRKLEDEFVALRAFVMTLKQEETASFLQMKQTFDENLEVAEKHKKKELAELWQEKNALALEVQKMAEKMQESLLYLASAAKTKEDTTKNQLMDQCYTMQTIHQNEFQVVLKKLDQVKHEETTDKHSLLAQIEKVMGMTTSLSAYASDVNNRLQEARAELGRMVDENGEKLLTRARDHEVRMKDWVKEKVNDVDGRMTDLISRYEATANGLMQLENAVERGNLAWTERYRNLEHTTETKCNAVEKHTEKKMQLLEFEVRSAVNSSLLDTEEKVRKNLQQQEENNQTFRKLITQQLIEKTRSIFLRGLADVENKLILKLEDNRGRIEQVNSDLLQLLREKMMDLQERIYRLADEAAQNLARVTTDLFQKIERAENDLSNRCDGLAEVTQELRILIEDTERKVFDDCKTLVFDTKEELEARIELEKESLTQTMHDLIAEEKTERMKQEAERMFGIQKRLQSFEDHVHAVVTEFAQRMNQTDSRHEDNQKRNEEKQQALGESVMEVLKLRELDQGDLKRRLSLVLDLLAKRCDELGVKLFEGDEEQGRKMKGEVDTLRKEKDKLKSEVFVLNIEKNAINTALEELVAEYRENLEELKQWREEELENRLKEMNAELVQERAAKETVAEEFAAYRAQQADALEDMKTLIGENEEKRQRENEEHKQEMEDLKTTLAENEAKRATEMEENAKTVEGLKTELEDSKTVIAGLREGQTKLAADQQNLVIEQQTLLASARSGGAGSGGGGGATPAAGDDGAADADAEAAEDADAGGATEPVPGVGEDDEPAAAAEEEE